MEKSFLVKVKLDFKRHKFKYLIFVPVLIWLILFCYKPMYGIIIAFQKFRPSLGIDRSPWVGLDQFQRAFDDPLFWRAFRNTITISFLNLLFSFPAPVLLAITLNEVRISWVKRLVQTLTYMPHFVAMVVVCGLLTTYCLSDGLFSQIIQFFGGEPVNLLNRSKYFYLVYIGSGVWQQVGWNSIIYLAALAGIDQEQYEAAKIDGASRVQQMIHITLPALVPTISMMLILNLGRVLGVGYEKILLLYQPNTYEVADVLSTYVYRKGLIDADYSFSTAVNLFNSVVNIIFLLTSNKISKKMGQSGLF